MRRRWRGWGEGNSLVENARLNSALVALTECLSITKDPWWLFGGAAFALMSYNSGSVKDIDVLVSDRDGQILSDRYGWKNHADGWTNKFQSTWFLKAALQGLPVEFMSGLRVKSGDQWKNVELQTRRGLQIDDAIIYLPEPAELRDLFELFGRPKDLERAERLRLSFE
jgi:hypothetical protein